VSRRRWTAEEKLVTGASVVLGAGAVLWLCMRRTEPAGLPASVPAQLPAPQPVVNVTVPLQVVQAPAAPKPAAPRAKVVKPAGAGVVLRGGRLEIEDLAALAKHAPEAIDKAMAAGPTSAEEVLATIMRQTLPEYGWPPASDSPLHAQWDAMVAVVASDFGLRAQAREDAKPAPLRLVKPRGL
jgi:hypothetical protein